MAHAAIAPHRTVGDLAAEHRQHTQTARTAGARSTADRADDLTTELRARGHHLLANALDDERHLVVTPVDLTADVTGEARAYRAAQLKRAQSAVRRLLAALGGA